MVFDVGKAVVDRDVQALEEIAQRLFFVHNGILPLNRGRRNNKI